MTTNKVMELISGEMEDNMLDIGKIINSMELENIQMPKDKNDKENGIMVKDWDGLMNNNLFGSYIMIVDQYCM